MDLFDAERFPCRAKASRIDYARFRLSIKTGMSEALREKDRGQIAAAMAHDLGCPGFSKRMLDNYTGPAATHEISLVRFKAFVRATDATHLWDIAVRDDGLLLLKGDEARLAEIARLEQKRKAIGRKLRALCATPVRLDRPDMGEAD